MALTDHLFRRETLHQVTRYGPRLRAVAGTGHAPPRRATVTVVLCPSPGNQLSSPLLALLPHPLIISLNRLIVGFQFKGSVTLRFAWTVRFFASLVSGSRSTFSHRVTGVGKELVKPWGMLLELQSIAHAFH